MSPQSGAAAARSCGTCSLCCKLISIAAFDKPRGVWCQHCDVGRGCRIYAARPDECANFVCGYLADGGLGEEWRPVDCGMVLAVEAHGERTVVHIHVDAGKSGIWRTPPFYPQIKRWALHAARTKGQVLVWHGRDVVAVLPDRDKSLGHVRDQQMIVTVEGHTAQGRRFDAMIVDCDDPLAARLS